MARNLVNRLWQSFLQLNLYKKPSSDAQTAPKEFLATRLYICSLAVVVLIITVTSALLLRTVNKTEYSPSHTRFSRLASKYADTIYCPCSSIGIAYSTFITTNVHFHQVCSSQFVQQSWIDLIFEERNNSSSSSDDYRTNLSFFWQVIRGLCSISNTTWIDVQAGFSASHTFSPVAITEQLVRTQAQITLDNAIYSARATLSLNLLAIRRVMSGNQIVSALATNFYLRYPPEDVDSTNSPRMSPRTYGNCSCLRSQGCPHPATFNNTDSDLITVPGMIADCLIMDGALASTLECYYSHSCLSLLHQSLSTDIQPLSTSLNQHFPTNATVEMLLNEIMIDEITNETRFDMFYSQCNPAYCSYSYTHRFDVLFVVNTVIGIFGGVSFLLRLIIPLIATMILRWRSKSSSQRTLPHIVVLEQRKLCVILNYIRLLPHYIRQAIVNFNMFESQRPRTPVNIFREQLLTRLFVLLFVILSIVAGFYTFLVVQNQVITIAHPSLAIYQQLYNDHSDTLQCPCSQPSIPTDSFLNVTFVLHQVCSSDLLSSAWLNNLESFDPIILPPWAVNFWILDFRTTGSSYFQLLAIFCSLAKEKIADAQRLLTNTNFVNDHVVALPLFNQQTDAIIESHIGYTRNSFQRVIDWVMITFTRNFFLTGTNVNFLIAVDHNDILTITNAFYALNVHIQDESFSFVDACSCPRDFSFCFIPDVIYTNGTTVFQFDERFDELPIGCLPLNGFLESTFRWWYNETYLKIIQDTYSRVIHSQSVPAIKPLNASVPTRFGAESLGTLLEEMFIEPPINNQTRFDQFYSQCAPSSCSYTIVRRRDLIVVLLLLVSICGGLNKILQILVRAFGKLIFFLIDWWRNRDMPHRSYYVQGSVEYSNSKDFRYLQEAFYDGLQQLCTLAQDSVDNSITIFNVSTMFVNEIMSSIRFVNEINETLIRFQQKTPIEFVRTLNLIRTTIQGNALLAGFQSNWQLVVSEKGKGRNASFYSVPVTYVDEEENTTCSCATSQACAIPAQSFYSNSTVYYTYPGLKLGCYLFQMILLSSLSCFYSLDCVNDFRNTLNLDAQSMVEYQNTTGNPIQLHSALTRFNVNDTIEVLANEMFIESWSTNVSYERFFNSCAPTYCTYKVYYRFDALELLSTFLSVYVGLSLGIHFIVPYLVKMVKKIRNRFRVVPVQ